MLALTCGLSGSAANALAELPATFATPEAPANELEGVNDSTTEVDPPKAAAVEPAALRPSFSRLKLKAQKLLRSQSPTAPTLSVERLEGHRRDLHRRSNEVESQLLGLQQLLSIQAYGKSFADRLLAEDAAYQAKLQQLQTLEAELHGAMKQADAATLSQLQNRLDQTDRELRQIAQTQLQRYIDQAQTNSTLGLWQEPMYRQSLRWLMEHTHERHQLNARQQTLADTLVAIAAN
ncbi:hypothetical protein N836_27515 [Leptolyngbya sp. Heron Island J]|nr:hypothetical protein N836_27515 [Leptolyngbya sp. Heron Island J]